MRAVVFGGLLDGQTMNVLGTHMINPLIECQIMGRRFDEIYTYDHVGDEWFLIISEVKER